MWWVKYCPKCQEAFVLPDNGKPCRCGHLYRCIALDIDEQKAGVLQIFLDIVLRDVRLK